MLPEFAPILINFLLKPDPILASIMLFLSYSWFICFDLKEYMYIKI